MRIIHLITLTLLGFTSCKTSTQIISVTNNSKIDRTDEIVELMVENPDNYTLFTHDGVQVSCQTTYDEKIVFPATVAANSTSKYELRKGKRLPLDTIATGDIYPQWFNDFAWENDKIAFRTYSKKMLETGNKLFGYDIFTKRSKVPILDVLYGTQFDKEYKGLIKELREKKSPAAGALATATSYHIDHGFGMDYYVVGPTLGCGTAALINNGEIAYPGFYDKCEILDKGGLRLTFRLTYAPVEINGDSVTEVRTITLDSGCHFNQIEVEYQGVTKQSSTVIGIVLHDDGETKELKDNYIAYAEPKHKFGWQTYNAVIFPDNMKASVKFFDEPKGPAKGHILTMGDYAPSTKLSYYMGAGWNRGGFPKPSDWFTYVKQQQQIYDQPLTVTFD